MIVIRNGNLDIESVKRENLPERHCFQYFKFEEDGSLYPIDHNDVSGEVFKFCIETEGMEDTFYQLEYESIIYGTDKQIHVFQGDGLEILITEQNGVYTDEIRNIEDSIYEQDSVVVTCE